MLNQEIYIPQLGEGLREVLIQELLKKPGDKIERNEPIYRMETDKAVVEGESPIEGVLIEWLADPGAIIPIGSAIARVHVASDIVPAEEDSQQIQTAARSELVNKPRAIDDIRAIPPRTRAYCLNHGIGPSEMITIAPAKGKLMPTDVDAYMEDKTRGHSETISGTTHEAALPQLYVDHPVSGQQRSLIFRLAQGAKANIPTTMSKPIDWSRIGDLLRAVNEMDIGANVSEFQILSYCIARATRYHPRFRSTITPTLQIREYAQLNLGIAVAKPDDELVTAVIAGADQFSLPEFINQFNRQIKKVWREGDQVDATTQLILSSLSTYGITHGVPVLVSPACATLFAGAPYQLIDKTVANLSITFDHRLVNGVGAAKFLCAVESEIEQLHASLKSSYP
jgi:pyruvate/2-oxoglutarate dehydrogenase complex dihydrolipoamide acyltransferase (E2) component